MLVSILADLPSRLIATTSMYTIKSEHFDKTRTHGESNFENILLERVFSSKENYLLTKLENRVFREIMVPVYTPNPN